MSWCPTDTSYLLTCAKDNRTICWDTISGDVSSLMFYFLFFYTPSLFIIRCLNISINQETTLIFSFPMQIVCELPASTNWNFDVHWYPRIPGVISASSFDGKIGLYNIEVHPF